MSFANQQSFNQQATNAMAWNTNSIELQQQQQQQASSTPGGNHVGMTLKPVSVGAVPAMGSCPPASKMNFAGNNSSTFQHNKLQQAPAGTFPANSQQQNAGQLQNILALLQQNSTACAANSSLLDWITMLVNCNPSNNSNSAPGQQQQEGLTEQAPSPSLTQPALPMNGGFEQVLMSTTIPPSGMFGTNNANHQFDVTPANQFGNSSATNLPLESTLSNAVPAPAVGQQTGMISNALVNNSTANQDLNQMLQSLQNQVSAVGTGNGFSSALSRQTTSQATLNFPPNDLAKITLSASVFAAGEQTEQQQNSNNKASKENSSAIAKKPKKPSTKVMPAPQVVIAGTTADKQILLYRDIDDFYLTEYQCLLRQQIELFEATTSDVQASAQGRNSPIEEGQVGIRCIHCSMLHIKCRSRGAVYFPRSIDGIYQVAQNLTKIHLCGGCNRVPESLRKKLTELSKVNKRASGGKRYWNERVRELGIYEDGKGIRFKKASS